jgi:uncharacterized protein (TIRG00374 family)
MTPRIRATAGSALRLVVVGGAVLFLVRGLAWGRVSDTLRGANLSLLATVVALNAGMMALKAARLRVLASRKASFKVSFLAKLTASAINNVTPLRGGDVTRLWILERHARISKSAAAALAVVESLFELVTLAAMSLVAAVTMPSQRWAVRVTPVLLGAAVILLVLLRRMNGWGESSRAVASPASITGRLRSLATRLAPGTRALRDTGTLWSALLLSFAIWGVEVAMVMVCASSIRLAISPALAAVVLLGINLAVALPSMPAGVGSFESGAVLVLVLSGMSKEVGVAVALLYHVVQVVPVTLTGLVVAWKTGVRLERLSMAPSEPLGGTTQLSSVRSNSVA